MGRIRGTKRDDELSGTAGRDKILGLAGDDVIGAWQGNDKVLAGAGNDLIYLYSGKDKVDGGKGFDMISLFYATQGVEFDLASRKVNLVTEDGSGTTRFKGIEGVWGSEHDDQISGDGKANDIFSNEGNDTIHGRGGDDVINGYLGNDTIFGGGGDDWLVLAPGADSFDGGKGYDGIDFSWSSVAVTASLGSEAVSFTSDEGTGTTTFTNVEGIIGSLFGDTLSGGSNFDYLYGSDGDDALSGLDGHDVLDGGAGSDMLTGGGGDDVFFFTARPVADEYDTITDFTIGEDILLFDRGAFKLKGVGEVYEYVGYEYQVLKSSQFQASDSDTAENRNVRMFYETDTGMLYYDANGSKAGKQAEVAQLDAGLDLRAIDFYVL